MARQIFVEGAQVQEDGEEETFVEGVQWNENQPSAPPGGLSIPIAMHHYKMLAGAN